MASRSTLTPVTMKTPWKLSKRLRRRSTEVKSKWIVLLVKVCTILNNNTNYYIFSITNEFLTPLLMPINITKTYPCQFIIYTDCYSVLLIVLDYCSFFFCLPSVSLGEFAEVFKGLYDGSTVAVKILKVRYNKSFVGGGGVLTHQVALKIALLEGGSLWYFAKVHDGRGRRKTCCSE